MGVALSSEYPFSKLSWSSTPIFRCIGIEDLAAVLIRVVFAGQERKGGRRAQPWAPDFDISPSVSQVLVRQMIQGWCELITEGGNIRHDDRSRRERYGEKRSRDGILHAKTAPGALVDRPALMVERREIDLMTFC